MRNGKKIRVFIVQWILVLVLAAALAVPAFADSIIHAPEFVASGITEGDFSSRVTGTRSESEKTDDAADQDMDIGFTIETPSAPEGYILDGRDCLFANGTPITILPPDAPVNGYVHDADVQKALENGLGPDERGSGAMITWKDGKETRYVLVSNLAQVYGGAYRRPLVSDTSIMVRGGDVTTDFPMLFLLAGGSLNADLTGDVKISLEESQIMNVVGGGYNGNVNGNVQITSDGRNWSMNIIGGGVAQSGKHKVEATVDGDVNMNLQGENYYVTDCIIGGGCAVAGSTFPAVSDVTGNVTMDLAGRDVYQVCAGGLAYSEDENVSAQANVKGGTFLRIDGVLRSDYPEEEGAYDPWPGIITGYGMSHYGEAKVKGEVEVEIDEETLMLDGAAGLYDEPVVENAETEAAAEAAAQAAEEEQIYNDDEYSITNMQIALSELGYYYGEADGSLGPQTIEAMQAYQEDHGLPVTDDVLASLLIELNVLR